jgi:hypothetical protein
MTEGYIPVLVHLMWPWLRGSVNLVDSKSSLWENCCSDVIPKDGRGRVKCPGGKQAYMYGLSLNVIDCWDAIWFNLCLGSLH